jgi:hypothetical protein
MSHIVGHNTIVLERCAYCDTFEHAVCGYAVTDTSERCVRISGEVIVAVQRVSATRNPATGPGVPGSPNRTNSL